MTIYEKKKLTLRMDKRIIDKAKQYASENDTSLSQLVEQFLGSLTHLTENNQHSELVQQLTGIIPEDIDLDKLRDEHIREKYGI